MGTTVSNEFSSFKDYAEGRNYGRKVRPTDEERAARREAIRKATERAEIRSWKKNHTDSDL